MRKHWEESQNVTLFKKRLSDNNQIYNRALLNEMHHQENRLAKRPLREVEDKNGKLVDVYWVHDEVRKITNLRNRAELLALITEENYDEFKSYWFERSKVPYSIRPALFKNIDKLIQQLGSEIEFHEFREKVESMMPIVLRFDGSRGQVLMDLHLLFRDFDAVLPPPAYGM